MIHDAQRQRIVYRFLLLSDGMEYLAPPFILVLSGALSSTLQFISNRFYVTYTFFVGNSPNIPRSFFQYRLRYDILDIIVEHLLHLTRFTFLKTTHID